MIPSPRAAPGSRPDACPKGPIIGGTLALWAVSLIGILVGGTLLRRVPGTWMHRGAAVMFLVFGVLAVGHVALDGAVL